MNRMLVNALAALVLVTGSVAPAVAAPCKDAKGKFTKCPTKPAKPQVCKNASGKFAKCGTPGAKPVK